MIGNQTKMIEAARELLRKSGFFVDNLWHVEDVHTLCEQADLPKVNDEEAMDIFSIANEQFDGETGLSWPQLERAVHTYFLRKTLALSLCKSA
jgi:hypothetical protein